MEPDLVERAVAVRHEPAAGGERDRVQDDGDEGADARPDRRRAARRCHAYCHVYSSVSVYLGPFTCSDTREYE